MITNDARSTREIKSRISTAKAAFNGKKIFYQQIGLIFQEQTGEVLRLDNSILWC
jgi:hypothetical protein